MTDATQDRAASVRGAAQGLATELAMYAESLLVASNRLRDGSMQAHGEAFVHVAGIQRRLDGMLDRIQANNRRWSEPADEDDLVDAVSSKNRYGGQEPPYADD